MRRVVLAVLFGLLARSASATAYYVAQNGGSDSNSCAAAQSVGAAKLTVNAGIACLASGDTLFIRTGTYDEQITSVIAGTAGAYTRIAAYPGTGGGSTETVWLKPTVNRIAVAAAIIWLDGPYRYIEFDGINLDQTFLAGNDGGSMVWYSTNNGNDVHHIRYKNAELIGAATTNSSGFSLGAHVAIGATGGHEVQHVVIHGGGLDNVACTARFPSSSDRFQCTFYGVYSQGPNNLIEDVEIYNVNTACVQLYSGGGDLVTNNIVRRVYCHDLTHWDNVGGQMWGIVIFTANANILYNNRITTVNNGGGLGDGIYIDSSASNNAIYNNTITGNAGTGINLGSGASGTIVRNNISYNNGTNYTNSGTSTTEDHNSRTGTNPNFVSAADVHLTSSSACCIDTGSSAVYAGDVNDYDLNSRPQGSAYDIGAYEFLGSGSGGGTGTWVRRGGTAVANVVTNIHPLTVTLGASASVNDRIIVGINVTNLGAVSITSVSDDCGNTYASDKSQTYADGTANGVAAIYSAPVTVAGACQVSVVWSGTGGAGISAVAYGALKTSSAVDVSASNHDDTNTSTAPASGNTGSTTAANELIIGFFADDGYARTFTAGGSAAVISGTAISSGSTVDQAMTEKDSGASGAAQSASGTLNSAAPWAEIAVVYKLAAAAATTATGGRLTLLGVGR